MIQTITVVILLILGCTTCTSQQNNAPVNARSVLIELDSILNNAPTTKEECDSLLNHIKNWKEKKLKELDTPNITFIITEPTDRAQVPQRLLVSGTIADANSQVWVIVHPTEVSDYWVQPKVTMRNGTWRVTIYIGRPGNIDVGKEFEIMAFANLKNSVKEGDKLDFWPEAQAKSKVITVTRR